MTADRIEQMRKMVRDLPEEPRTRYFLAHELFRSKEWQEAAEHYEAYLRLSPGDEGAGWKNYGICLDRLGRRDDARAAYRSGIERALSHHHEALAGEMEELLEQLD